jgi:tetratricopeptide (TPR) repeat protein
MPIARQCAATSIPAACIPAGCRDCSSSDSRNDLILVPEQSTGDSGPKRPRQARRGWRLLAGLIGACLLAWGGWYALGAWSFRSELSAAREEVARGHFARAKQRLADLARRWPHDSAVAYGLGVCERAEGRLEAAMDAWGRVPPGTPEAPQAALERGRIATKLGRYRPAEESLVQAWTASDSQIRAQAYEQLGWLLQIEGRHRDVRRLIERAGDLSAWALRTFWLLDVEPVTVESVRDVLATAAQAAPDDDRVWLAQANLALRLGQIELAGKYLDRCEQAAPADTAVAHARLDWALAAGRDGTARGAIARLLNEDVTPAEVAALRAWFARRAHDRETERRALEALLQADPASGEALERLSELAFQSGHPQEMELHRRRKAELDRIRDHYHRFVKNGDPATQCGDAARWAEQLGRRYEAQGWARWRMRNVPSDADAQAILDRLARQPPVALPPGRSVVELLELPEERLHSGRPADQDSSERMIRFLDDAQPAGLTFQFDNGRSTSRQLPETMSGGVGLLDFDGDGYLDVYVVQGGHFPPETGFRGDRLYRNRGDGTFEDATAKAGIDRMSQGYGHGVAIGDYDNDGDPDLFITRWRSYALYRNEGGRFVDATVEAGLAGDRDWPTSAAFADLDGDGDLDLYVCHYVAWNAENPKVCWRKDTNEANYCTPVEQPALPDHVYRNEHGRFVDVSAAAGISETDTDGRGLGVIAAQLDDDMKIDLYVANDMTANYLFRNLGGWKFEDVALASGAAGNAEGGYQAGMGIACGDLDGDGRVDLAVTNFYGEGTTLYHNLGSGMFTDRSREWGLTVATKYRLGFGTSFLDADNDGWLDMITANGHVNEFRKLYPYAMPVQLLRNTGAGQLRDVSSQAGDPFSLPHVGRGLATGDLDNDGLLDVVVIVQNEPLVLLANRTERAGDWVTFRLEGTASNRDGVGAIVTVKASGRTWVLQRFGGGSYQSAGDPRIHLGLGKAARIEEVEVRWPSGKVDRFRELKVSRGYLLREGAGPRPLASFR